MKKVDPYFFLSGLCPFLNYAPLKKCNEILQARDLKVFELEILKLNMLIGDDELMN